jgi:hypothetical protein
MEVAKLRAGGATDEARGALRKYLGHKSNIVVAKAAEVSAALGLGDLAPEMEGAFGRFFEVEDKGCLAKTAIVVALNAMSAGSEGTFVRGLHHVQMEASWGPPVDVAGGLRATSALALASRGLPAALLAEISDLLADPVAGCRSAAARALAHAGHDSAALPLRLKLLAGDPEPEVVEECLAALVALAPKKSVGFLERLLGRAADASARGAILVALGTTRDDEALSILLRRFERDITPASRAALLPAVALTRLPRAVDFLLDLVATANRALAADALRALGQYRHDQNVISRAGKVVAERDESELSTLSDVVFRR